MPDKAEQYDERMISKFGEYYFKTIRRIVELAHPKSTDVVIDLGAGTGAVSFAMAPWVKKVMAIDIDQGMLEEAKRKAEGANVQNIEFKLGSFLEPNVGEKADIIVSNIALHHLTDEDKAKAIRKMAELLNENGRIVLADVMIFSETAQKEIDDVLDAIREYFGSKKSRAIKELRVVFKKRYPAKYEDLERMFKEAGLEIVKVEKMFSIFGIISARKASAQ